MTIAIWCIFIAATLPYVAFSFVKGLDPDQPRYHAANWSGSRYAPTALTSMASRPSRGSLRR